jgi:hypothetical protein
MPNPITVTWEEFLKSTQVISKVRTVDRCLDHHILAELFSELEAKEIVVNKIYTNTIIFADVRKWDHNIVKMETSTDEISKGNLAKIWGATFIVSMTVPQNTVLICDEGNTKAAILEINSNIPHAKDLLLMHDKLREMMGHMQSLLAQSTDLIKNLVRVVEKVEQPK